MSQDIDFTTFASADATFANERTMGATGAGTVATAGSSLGEKRQRGGIAVAFHGKKRLPGRFGASFAPLAESSVAPTGSPTETTLSKGATDLLLGAYDRQRAVMATIAQCGDALRTTSASQFSLGSALFVNGVPDVEPWDTGLVAVVGKYSSALRPNCPSITNHIFHPAAFAAAAVKPPAPAEFRLMKTPEELRAERRERLRQKQAADAALKKASQGTETHKDKLSLNRVTAGQLSDYALNPLRADEKVREQVLERVTEHERRNYENHIAALPQQIAKKEVMAWRDATKNPTLQVFHVFPTNPEANDCVNRLRNYANEQDARMRGFLLWTQRADLFIVLCGGEKPMRHVTRWIQKMRWASGSSGNNQNRKEDRELLLVGSSSVADQPSISLSIEPKITHCFSTRLSCLAEYSFHLPRPPPEAVPRTMESLLALEHTVEPVFVKIVDSASDAATFIQQQPAYGPLPSLAPLWRAAYGH